MEVPKEKIGSERELLSLISMSKHDLIKVFQSKDETSSKEIYLKAIAELERSLITNEFDRFVRLTVFFDYVSVMIDQATLKTFYDDPENHLGSTNLVILACMHNAEDIVKNLFCGSSRLLNNLSIDIGRNSILPDDEDETGHNAFYYAIRSGNVELLDILYSKWPGNYFATHLEELDNLTSRAFEELKLLNVAVPDTMEISVVKRLLDLRYFNNSTEQIQRVEDSQYNIQERIEIVLDKIAFLKAEYTDGRRVDEKFIFISKFVAQNFHVLKQKMKSTYDKLPWEEIEFCLVSFVSSHIRKHEINFFYRAKLNKDRILNHLQNFADKLKDEKGNIKNIYFSKLLVFPNKSRDLVVLDIIDKYPQFEELYNDYQTIRDVCSLMRINDHINVALTADPKVEEGQLIISRALQVTGENLKNTLQSPKLSNATSELLLLYLPNNTRKIISALRNSLSHTTSLSQRIEIEEKVDDFFIGVQNDIGKVRIVIADILHRSKIKMMRILLKDFNDAQNLEEMKEITQIFINAQLNESISKNFKITKLHKIELLVEELSNNISDKTMYEMGLFKKIADTINYEKTKEDKHSNIDYLVVFSILKGLNDIFNCEKMDTNSIRTLKFGTNKMLEILTPKGEPSGFQNILKLVSKIDNSVSQRVQHDEIKRLWFEIFYLDNFEASNIKCIEDFQGTLQKKSSPLEDNDKISEYHYVLSKKITQLKNALKKNTLSVKIISTCESDKKNQILIEMLLLDILSILDGLKCFLKNDVLFLDDNYPLLIGKCLRNHLAHENALIDILSLEPTIQILLSAEKLILADVIQNEKTIGKFVKDDPLLLKHKYYQNLTAIENQEKFFVSLRAENLETLKLCVRNGADIYARNFNFETTLHFAAMGSSLEIIKFLHCQNLNVTTKNVFGQSPLHIAAAHGRSNILQYLLDSGGLLDDTDDSGKTVLHIAAHNGHKVTVELLIKCNADIHVKDNVGFSPLHYAVKNDYEDIFKILIAKERNVDDNEINGGFTVLHIASENGILRIVNFLLQNGANVNAETDAKATPLHLAALNGHLEVVDVLIVCGAHVNAKNLNGCTALHFAVEKCREKVIEALLKNRADVNVADKIYFNTPLHYATQDGCENIVKMLLKNGANTEVFTINGFTPLHFAINNGHIEIVTLLLKHRVDVNVITNEGFSLLHLAAQSGVKEIVNMLLKIGARVNAKAKDDSTPLHAAAQHGNLVIVEILIKNKADVNAQNKTGVAPLHVAAEYGHSQLIDILVSSKAEISVTDKKGNTPLHVAIFHSNEGVIGVLIEKGANINVKNKDNFTPIDAAACSGNKDIVKTLMQKGAVIDSDDMTPLHIAAVNGHKEVIEVLVANGANINSKSKNGMTPLMCAVMQNNKVVDVLIANGADVDHKVLSIAVSSGYSDILSSLLKNLVNINTDAENESDALLYLASIKGHKRIVDILLAKGFDANVITNSTTPLHGAAFKGHKEVAKALIAKGADINFQSDDGSTPLHYAAKYGYVGVVEALLNCAVNVNIKDKKNRIPLELAVADGHLEVVKKILQCKETDVNAKANKEFSLLHIAAQSGCLDIIKYLVSRGANINVTNDLGSKPIHIAAREGHEHCVEFFLSRKASSIDERGAADATLLHYASLTGQSKVVQFLMNKGINANVKDRNGSTPMHYAAMCGSKDCVHVLLLNGSVYNDIDKLCRTPSAVAIDVDVQRMLTSIDKLFKAVIDNNISGVEHSIKEGAFVDARNVKNITPLLHASWKGYGKVVNVLMENKANPNIFGKDGFSPLHYASKFAHLDIVKMLLSNGAIYNAKSVRSKTPLDFNTHEDIGKLLKQIDEAFVNVEYNNIKVIKDLKKIKEVETIKAIMNACNTKNETLLVAAEHSSFSKIKELKMLFQEDNSIKLYFAEELLRKGDYQQALPILKVVFDERSKLLGTENPSSLDIQMLIAKTQYKQGAYQEAHKAFEEIFLKRRNVLGLLHQDTLNAKSSIALVLHRQGKNEEALCIYREVCLKQTEILGPNHQDTLESESHMALVLDNLEKYDEALKINWKIFNKSQELYGTNSRTLSAQNNIALVLQNQGKFDEALDIYKEVYAKKQLFFGKKHPDTLRTLHNVAGVFLRQKKHKDALKIFEDVLKSQQEVLGQNHPETLNTQHNMAISLMDQGKVIGALKIFKECINGKKSIYGENHPQVLDILKRIEAINICLKFKDNDETDVIRNFQNEINIASSNGDARTVRFLLENGADANDKDLDGRTPLHYAVDNGHIDIVNLLLVNKADVTQVTNKGNTPLHTAVSKGYKEIIEVLLKHLCFDRNKLSNFINAQTVLKGTTSLHIAAEKGILEVVICLLKYGAIYNVKNKEGKTPLQLSKDEKITNLLKLVEELFTNAKKGDIQIFNTLGTLGPNEFAAALNAHNDYNNTLIQVSGINKHKHIVKKLLELLKSKSS